jgi:hypothetical protein
MKHFWQLVTFVFFLSFPVWYLPIIVNDLQHPEIWDGDWRHDPRIYLPMYAVLGILAALMAVYILYTEWRSRR